MTSPQLFTTEAFKRGWSSLPAELKIQILDAYLDSVLPYAENYVLHECPAGFRIEGRTMMGLTMRREHNAPCIREVETNMDLFVRAFGQSELQASLTNKLKASDMALAERKASSWRDVVTELSQRKAHMCDPHLRPKGMKWFDRWRFGLKKQNKLQIDLAEARNLESQYEWLHKMKEIAEAATTGP